MLHGHHLVDNESNTTARSANDGGTPRRRLSLASGIALGIAIGAALGVAMDNIAVGIGFGIGIGISISLAMSEKRGRV
jgi:hypothetical protein